MTANHDTHTRSDNSTPRVPNPDAQAVYEYLQTVDSATLEGLAAKAGLPETQLTDILDDLQDKGLVDVETGFRAVTISTVDDIDQDHREDDIATDGGPIHTLVDAVRGDAAAIDLTPAQVWTALSSQRRRKMLRLLGAIYEPETESYVDLSDLAEVLVETSPKPPSHPPEGDTTHAAYVSLSQTHAPLLDSYDLVQYYRRPKKVQPTADIVDVARVLGWVDAACDRDQEGSA